MENDNKIIDVVLNPFNLNDESALQFCVVFRSMSAGVPLPQSKIVLGSLKMLSIGFNDIYDHVDSGSVLPGGGSNGITIHPNLREKLSQFYINVGNAVFDAIGFDSGKTFANLTESESNHLHTQCGYTIARSVSQMNPDGSVRDPLSEL